MSRLTEKNKFDIHYSISISKNLLQSAYDKLGKLEDLEEELGCPLEVLFKAISNGVWVEVNPMDIDIDNPKDMYFEEFVKLEKDLDGTLRLNCYDYVDELNLADYKKTWWLKEDRSE